MGIGAGAAVCVPSLRTFASRYELTPHSQVLWSCSYSYTCARRNHLWFCKFNSIVLSIRVLDSPRKAPQSGVTLSSLQNAIKRAKEA